MTIPQNKIFLFFFGDIFVLFKFHGALIDDGEDKACPPGSAPALRAMMTGYLFGSYRISEITATG
jgi:hypothetical protein